MPRISLSLSPSLSLSLFLSLSLTHACTSYGWPKGKLTEDKNERWGWNWGGRGWRCHLITWWKGRETRARQDRWWRRHIQNDLSETRNCVLRPCLLNFSPNALLEPSPESKHFARSNCGVKMLCQDRVLNGSSRHPRHQLSTCSCPHPGPQVYWELMHSPPPPASHGFDPLPLPPPPHTTSIPKP
jgi:hypothetical protein